MPSGFFVLNHIASITQVAEPLFAKKDYLGVLLTVEGLLFASLSIAVGFVGSSTFGAKTIVPPAGLAFGAFGVLALVAAAAVLAWADLFGGPHWPHSVNSRLEALAILVAIVAQPIISLIVALGIWRG